MKKKDKRRLNGLKAKERHNERVKIQMPMYGHLYEKVVGEEGTCAYCREEVISPLRDYAPPITILNEDTVKLYKEFSLRQACSECHSLLRSYRRANFKTRLGFLERAYRKAIASIVKPWVEKKIAEMGRTMEDYIRANPITSTGNVTTLERKLGGVIRNKNSMT